MRDALIPLAKVVELRGCTSTKHAREIARAKTNPADQTQFSEEALAAWPEFVRVGARWFVTASAWDRFMARTGGNR